MTYSEQLGNKHDSNISPEILESIDSLYSQIDPVFAITLEKYRSGIIDLLKANPEYTNHPIVLKALKEQNARFLEVLSPSYKNKEKRLATMQVANDDIGLKIAA